MSRLKAYLNNSKDLSEAIEGIKSDCAPFIKEMKISWKTFPRLFYRGMESTDKYIHTVRKDRRPLSTPREIHDLVDFHMKKKFGWKPRSEGVFATSDSQTASTYGKSCYFFPIGNYKYIWSPSVRDLFVSVLQYGVDVDKKDAEKTYEIYWDSKKAPHNSFLKKDPIFQSSKSKKEYVTRAMKNRDKILNDNIKKYVDQCLDDGLEKALYMDREVMFRCDSYYAINKDMIDGDLLIKELIE